MPTATSNSVTRQNPEAKNAPVVTRTFRQGAVKGLGPSPTGPHPAANPTLPLTLNPQPLNPWTLSPETMLCVVHALCAHALCGRGSPTCSPNP